MEPRSGHVRDGRIVLDDDTDLDEGAPVTVWVGDPAEPVEVSDEELRLIRAGQAEAAAGKMVDASAFLRALRETV